MIRRYCCSKRPSKCRAHGRPTFTEKKRQFTQDVEVSNLAHHGLDVQLTHVRASIGRGHVFDRQLPRRRLLVLPHDRLTTIRRRVLVVIR